MTTALQDIETLPLQERILMVEDLWDSIAKSHAEVPVLGWQKKELSRRKRNFRKNPNSVMTWQQVKQSVVVRHA
jgi:putative addiction module component (TIGR02574 family)